MAVGTGVLPYCQEVLSPFSAAACSLKSLRGLVYQHTGADPLRFEILSYLPAGSLVSCFGVYFNLPKGSNTALSKRPRRSHHR